MSFEIKKTQHEGLDCFEFIGPVDEEAVFPDFDNLASEVYVDLKAVSSINSVGIRAWVIWFGQYPNTYFKFINCPKALVMQMNMVEGFLPDKSEVLTLQVPFYCEECDEEKEVMFEVGKNVYLENGKVVLQYDKSSICKEDCDPELDVSEAKFFRFLTLQQGNKAA